MSIVNNRTGRHEDNFMAKLYDGSATVGDLLDHAQEIIVESPGVWGTVVSEPVRLLIMLLDLVTSEDGYDGLDLQQHTNLRELEAQVR